MSNRKGAEAMIFKLIAACMTTTALVAYGANGLAPVPTDTDLSQHFVPVAVLIGGISLTAILVWKVATALAKVQAGLEDMSRRLTTVEDEQKRQRK
jgi:hypothetical protein